MQVNQQHINKSLKIYLYSPFIKTEEYNKNMMILEKMGHKITNEYYLNKTKSEEALLGINNADIIILDATNYPDFCIKKWIYSVIAINLNKEIWVISETLKDSPYITIIFKDWTEVYSELHPI